MTQLKLWKFSEDYGRYGEVEGLFIASEEEIDKFLDKNMVSFGEILGKHSDVDIDFEKGKNLKCLEVSESTINELFIASNCRTIMGYNPFDYIYYLLNCSNCYFEGAFDGWWDVLQLENSICCPQCGSKNYIVEK